jgi:acyl carrier protein
MSEAYPVNRDAAERWIRDYIAAVVDLPAAEVPLHEHFPTFGVDSAEVVIMTGVMEEEFGIDLDPRLLFANPSIAGFLDALEQNGLVRR